MQGHQLEYGLPTMDQIPGEKITAPFQVDIKHKPLQVRTGLYAPLPDLCRNIDWIDGACLVQVTKPALNSWLQ